MIESCKIKYNLEVTIFDLKFVTSNTPSIMYLATHDTYSVFISKSGSFLYTCSLVKNKCEKESEEK